MLFCNSLLTGLRLFGIHISIHTKPLTGLRLFGDSHFYPYETPNGAEAFWRQPFATNIQILRSRGILESDHELRISIPLRGKL